MRLPDPIKHRLRRKEDGRDVVGVTVSLRTVKTVVKWIKKHWPRGKVR